MHRIKEFLQKKKGLGPVAALVLLAAVLGLAIALRAGKLENMFDPDSFVTQEEQKEEFDPREYGLEEDGRKIGSGTPAQGVWRLHRRKEF